MRLLQNDSLIKYLLVIQRIVEAIRRIKAFLINLLLPPTARKFCARRRTRGMRERSLSRHVSKSSPALVSSPSLSFFWYCRSNPNGAAACSTWSRSPDLHGSREVYKFSGPSLRKIAHLAFSRSILLRPRVPSVIIRQYYEQTIT